MAHECKHGNDYPGYYKHPKKDVIVVFCTKCYEEQHPLKSGAFITRYGQKLIAAGGQK